MKTADPHPTGPRLLLDFWKAYGEKVAYYETLVVLTAVYTFVVAPISLLARLFHHRFLPSNRRGPATLWHDTQMGTASPLDNLGKQG
jgi:hypothetical protein